MAQLDSWSEDVVLPLQDADGSLLRTWLYLLLVMCLYLTSSLFLFLPTVLMQQVGISWCNPKNSQAVIWSGHLQTSEEVAPVRFSEICCD